MELIFNFVSINSDSHWQKALVIHSPLDNFAEEFFQIVSTTLIYKFIKQTSPLFFIAKLKHLRSRVIAP